MNKIQKTFVFLIILFSVATLSYKLGDSNGYEAGYTEGYRYDCKEEIAVIYNRVRSQSGTVESLNKKVSSVIRENDSLKNKEKFQLFEKERQAWQLQLKKDSIKYHSVVEHVNDSLAKVTGFHGILLADGHPNAGICSGYPALKGLKECDPHYRVELPKKKRKGKK